MRAGPPQALVLAALTVGSLAAGGCQRLPSQLARLLIAVEQPGSPIPLGTGPYRITRWSRGGEVELEALHDHRDGRPPVARVVFEPITDPAAATRRLLAGDVQLVPEPDGQAWHALRSNPRLRTHERPSLRVLFLGINSLPDSPRPELRDVRVRRALRRALDPAEWLATTTPAPGYAFDARLDFTPRLDRRIRGQDLRPAER